MWPTATGLLVPSFDKALGAKGACGVTDLLRNMCMHIDTHADAKPSTVSLCDYSLNAVTVVDWTSD